MRHLVFTFTFFVLSGCANVPSVQHEARRSSELPNCRSVVEASLRSDTLYSSKPPLLILRKSYNTSRVLRGAIVDLTDSGVVFLREKDGLSTPDPTFFPFEDVECLIDSNNRLRWGEWKGSSVAFWNVELVCQRTDSLNSKPVTIVLDPNKTVSYCIGPGEYKIVRLRFRGFDDYVDQSDSLCCSRFKVASNAVTYLGTFILEYKWDPSPDMTIIPITVLHRPGMNESPFFLGGAIGGALQHLADRERAERVRLESPFHALKVAIDSTFVPISRSGLPLKISPVSFEELE